MNGSNSNTSGSAVANIGFWPKGILEQIISRLQQGLNQLEELEAGTQLPVALDFAPKGDNDKIPDITIAEIARRLIATVEKQEQGNIIYSPTPPEDHSKAWIETDPVTGLPTDGLLRVWDEDLEAWVVSEQQGGYVPPKKRFIKERVNAGASTINFNFADIQTDNYFPTLTFTTQNDDGSWAAPPGSYPAGFGYLVTGKTNTTLTVAFYGVPTGGFMVQVEVEEIPAS